MTEQRVSTPKRKHVQMLHDGLPELDTTMQFTFELQPALDDGNASPRTNIAHRFRGLALESGAGGDRGERAPSSITIPTQTTIDDATEDGPRKRAKAIDTEMYDRAPATGADGAMPSSQASERSLQGPNTKPAQFALDATVIRQAEPAVHTSFAPGDDADTEPAADGNPDSAPPRPAPRSSDRSTYRRRTSSSRRRAGTPPLASRSRPATTTTAAAAAIDPLRASLTWQDDEITVYDPEDSDDDGTGINGIGFKPTPAIAYARAMRRRQQLAEYRKREEREARARRSLRRRGAGPGEAATAAALMGMPSAAKKRGKVEQRRVRFLDSAVEMIGA